jgi:formate/nitrite transporter FocA (FNT family)
MAGAARLTTISVARTAIKIIVLVDFFNLLGFIIFVFLSLVVGLQGK